jgi:hypothetical protein
MVPSGGIENKKTAAISFFLFFCLPDAYRC